MLCQDMIAVTLCLPVIHFLSHFSGLDLCLSCSGLLTRLVKKIELGEILWSGFLRQNILLEEAAGLFVWAVREINQPAAPFFNSEMLQLLLGLHLHPRSAKGKILL